MLDAQTRLLAVLEVLTSANPDESGQAPEGIRQVAQAIAEGKFDGAALSTDKPLETEDISVIEPGMSTDVTPGGSSEVAESRVHHKKQRTTVKRKGKDKKHRWKTKRRYGG